MDGRGVAWVPYIPLPGLGWLAVALAPMSRLVRYHAWQGTLTTLGLLLFLLVMGLVARISDAAGYRTFMGAIAGIGLLVGLGQCGWGAAGAALGRFSRVRPWWDLAAILRR